MTRDRHGYDGSEGPPLSKHSFCEYVAHTVEFRKAGPLASLEVSSHWKIPLRALLDETETQLSHDAVAMALPEGIYSVTYTLFIRSFRYSLPGTRSVEDS